MTDSSTPDVPSSDASHVSAARAGAADGGSQQIPGYQLLAKVGKGGMGTVYKARQISLDRVVAIKVLPRKYASDPKFIEQLYAEGKAAAKLNHPNIVGALDVGQTLQQGQPVHYFVMEYVEGSTVYDELMENVRYDEDEALPIMVAMARALEHAHGAGMIHRDVKPQNMMLTKQGVPKLADMGLARGAGGSSEGEEDGVGAKQVVGSPFYMSPEQIRNEAGLDFRTDIYSLGASFYYMLAGKPVFDEPTVQQVLKAHLIKPAPSIQKANAQVSDGLSQIIKVCLAKAKEERYDRTGDLVADLEAVLAGGLPLHAASKLGMDDGDEDEPLTREPQQGEKVQGRTALAGEAGAPAAEQRQVGPAARIAHARQEPASIVRERCFWPAVAGWAAAAVLALLYVMK